jgi:hypothetical protein
MGHGRLANFDLQTRRWSERFLDEAVASEVFDT